MGSPRKRGAVIRASVAIIRESDSVMHTQRLLHDNVQQAQPEH